jgi:hypothetical protein
MRRALATTVIALAVLAPPAAAASRLHQLVVFRDGNARVSQPAFGQTTAKVGARRCTVAGGTPLAALIRSRVGRLSLHDYGSCGKRAADSSSLFVAAIGRDRNRGSDGWVYKTGNVLGTAGAADPGGPLGRGRLRVGAHVTWFWCHVTAGDNGCPHTLTASVTAGARELIVHVRQYDDRGHWGPASGATVHAGAAAATTDSDGSARLALAPGRYRVWASQPGRIRSFPAVGEVK